MLNKELLLGLSVEETVNVTLSFFGGRNTGTQIFFIDKDGKDVRRSFFDERREIVTSFQCLKNSEVYIEAGDFRDSKYNVVPPQDITIAPESYRKHLIFTAYQDVSITF